MKKSIDLFEDGTFYADGFEFFNETAQGFCYRLDGEHEKDDVRELASLYVTVPQKSETLEDICDQEFLEWSLE